ncbi:hypothetical protein L5515_006465 [Caenorhabditis briggsae]|uniref:BTB domain-containing protein n=1 Tax=Caenorhabditis briggsae TaxID=6238 RepID=A0AAE9F2Q0_CAEBR|nr:hypothetical protein L5515_006465 [Caenorhabditis briggsae]
MCFSPIEYTSDDVNSSIIDTKELDRGSKDGLTWIVTYSHQLALCHKLTDCAYLMWQFDWRKLKNEGSVDGFSGDIIVTYRKEKEKTAPIKFYVEFSNPQQEVVRRIGPTSDIKYSEKYPTCYITFDLHLTPYKLPYRNLPIDQAFLPSTPNTDGILVVENRRMHINKTYLSVQSAFFQTMFSSNFMEKSMAEVPIGGVKYDEFARLLAIVSLKPVFPTDESVENLLALAERFLMPAIVCHVEHHLLTATHFDFFRLLSLADKHNLEKLTEKCIESLTTLGQISRNRHRAEYIHLSRDTKARILDHLTQV